MSSENDHSKPRVYDDEENCSEDEIEIPAGVADTMLTASDFVTENERQCILNVAPAEGNTL